MDWEKIEQEYITTNATYKELSKKFDVDLNMVKSKGRADGWFDKKKQYFAENGLELAQVGRLKPLNTRTKEERSLISRKAGIKSGIVRNSKKNARECMNTLLALDIKDEKIRKSLEQFGVSTEDLQNRMLLMFQLMKNGIKTGDASTIKSILEIAGEFTAVQEEQKPVINITVSEATAEDINMD